jgi:DNA invertase Pin-like site-specific DNA recombinase
MSAVYKEEKADLQAKEKFARDLADAGRPDKDTKLAWIYARASHVTNSDTDSVPAQIERCRMRFKMNWEPKGYVLARIKPDLVTSASKINFFNRTNGAAIGRLATAGDVILVDKMDRIFRSLADFCNTQKELDERGVILEIGDCMFCSDPKNPFYKAMIAMMAMFAEMEAAQKSVRIKDVFARRLQAGAEINGIMPIGIMLVKRRREGFGEKPLKFREWDPWWRSIQNAICVKADIEGWTCEQIKDWLNTEVFMGGKKFVRATTMYVSYPVTEKMVTMMYWWEKMYRMYGFTDAKQTRNWDYSTFGKLKQDWKTLKNIGWLPLPE